MNIKRPIVIVSIVLLVACAQRSIRAEDTTNGPFRIAAFQVDITPDLGESGKAKKILDPIYFKGVLIDDGKTKYVVSVADVLFAFGFEAWTTVMGKAVGIPAEQVAYHVGHQHSAPGALSVKKYGKQVVAALKEAEGRLQKVTHIGYGVGKVERVAANRKIKGYGHTRKTHHKGHPGVMDPYVRTITFFDGEKPLLRMHYYGSHSCTMMGRGISADVFGGARKKLEDEEKIPHLVFSGCNGNTGMMMWFRFSGTEEERAEDFKGLVDRLSKGMQKAIDSSERAEISGPVQLKSLPIEWVSRGKTFKNVLCAMKIGPVTVLHLPSGPIQIQLAANEMMGKDFVAVAAEGRPHAPQHDRAFYVAKIAELLGKEAPAKYLKPGFSWR